MLKVRLLGRFEVRWGEETIEIPSRPAQSLLAYLILNAGTPQRREKLAGLLWPESTEVNARSNLRHALWRLRKALGTSPQTGREYLCADDITIGFDATADYWLDVAVLDRKADESWSADDLIEVVSVYGGELLPGFYDEWVTLERERLQAVFEHKMGLLLERLVDAGRWSVVLEWGERWIALGHTPEPAYRALMVAHNGLGDTSSVAAVFQRCIEALRQELGVEPSRQTRDLYERLSGGEMQPPSPALRLEAPDEAPAPGEPPFKGLQHFVQDDADIFFGRELLTARLVARLDPKKGARFLAVVGASGSGKSSIVRAGLIPALGRTDPLADGSLPPDSSVDWPVHVITPSTHPLEALAVSLTRDAESVTATATLMDDLARDSRSLHLFVRKALGEEEGYLLLAVDQFEELFTLCRSKAERLAFVNNLMAAVVADGPTIVLIALRADFYAHCGQFARLREALEKRQVYIGPMSPEELRRAMVGPAQQGDWAFEPGLVELLLQEVGDEPGALPLLSHALLETWRRRRGRTLTLSGYRESGGVRGAVAQTAERVLQGLTPEEQAVARRVFLRLTELGEGTQETRRRASLSELMPGPEDAPKVEAVLGMLADARLITVSQEGVEVAHEALIREWPRLRRWLDEDRAGLQLHRHLTEAAGAWVRMDRDPGELYRGARLAQAGEWAEAHGDELNPLEGEFLEASQALTQRREAEREAGRQRELEAAHRLAEAERQRAEEQARTGRRLRWLAAGLALFLLAAFAAAFLALGQRNRAEEQARLATARELAAAAFGNLGVDPERSVLLALQAVTQTYAVDGTVLPGAEEALHQAVQALRVQFTVPGNGVVAFSPDGARLATGRADGTVTVFDAVTGQELLTLSGHSEQVQAIAYSADGTRLAAGSADGAIGMWDAEAGEQLLALRTHTPVLRTTFSPDGTRLATSDYYGTVKVLDAATGQLLVTLFASSEICRAIAFSPDGTRLAMTDHNPNVVRVWDLEASRIQRPGQEVLTLTGHTRVIADVAFSPDGTRLATASWSGTRVWDAASGKELIAPIGRTRPFRSVAFSSDGARLATGSYGGLLQVWDAATGRELFTLAGHSNRVKNVVFSPDGTRLATGSADGTTKVWDICPEGGREWLTLSADADLAYSIAFSPDGTRLATAGWDGTARVWDISTGQEWLTLVGHSARITGIAFSPDGRRLATSSWDGTVKAWGISGAATGEELLSIQYHGYYSSLLRDVAFSSDGTRLAAGTWPNAKVWDATTGDLVSTMMLGHSGVIQRLAFSPDGTRLATAGSDGTGIVWDVATGQVVLVLREHTDTVEGIAFSPDGSRVVTCSSDGTSKVWDLEALAAAAPGKGKASLTLHGHAGVVLNVAFSPDGSYLATASADGTVKLWDWEASLAAGSGKERLTLVADINGVDLAFSPDGKYLAATSEGGMVRLYVLQIEDLVDLARSRLTRTWTLEECQKFLHMEQCPPTP